MKPDSQYDESFVAVLAARTATAYCRAAGDRVNEDLLRRVIGREINIMRELDAGAHKEANEPATPKKGRGLDLNPN